MTIEEEIEMPTGCLSCNTDEVSAALIRHGADPDRCVMVPPPRHRWPDVMPPCEVCGTVFLIRPAK